MEFQAKFCRGFAAEQHAGKKNFEVFHCGKVFRVDGQLQFNGCVVVVDFFVVAFLTE